MQGETRQRHPLHGTTRCRPAPLQARAAAALIRPSQRATGGGIGSPETVKLATAFRVSPPHSSVSREMLRISRESNPLDQPVGVKRKA
jgi:hypothetical protein